ncbi:MAG: hypothetical protein K0U61_04145 [Alphaproteobacteria bacterium]|nr:hypothetical protein [Alphaproteobacteria bacterium]
MRRWIEDMRITFQSDKTLVGLMAKQRLPGNSITPFKKSRFCEGRPWSRGLLRWEHDKFA